MLRCPVRGQENEVRRQLTRVIRVGGCLNGVVWRNKRPTVEPKSKIFEEVVRWIIVYTADLIRYDENKKDVGNCRVICKIKRSYIWIEQEVKISVKYVA